MGDAGASQSKIGRVKKFCPGTFLGKKWQDRLIEVTDTEIKYWASRSDMYILNEWESERPKKRIPMSAISRVRSYHVSPASPATKIHLDFKRKAKPPTNHVLVIEYTSETGKAETLCLSVSSSSELAGWMSVLPNGDAERRL